MRRAPCTAAALVALLAAAACDEGSSSSATTVGPAGPTGPQGPRGPEGPQGPQGPAGERGATAPSVVARTASGELVGPIFGAPARAGAPYPGPVAVWVSALARVALLDVASGAIQANAVIVFAADGCGGPAYGAGEMSEQTVAVNGPRLFALASTEPVQVAARSALKDGECLPLQTSGTYYPAVELHDARYPYAAPLRLALE